MLLSMTGFGEAHHQADGLAVAVEVRTINNRFFKFSMRSGEGYTALESQVEGLVREQIKRGTVQVNLRVARQSLADDYTLNAGVLESYRRQLSALQSGGNKHREVPLESLLLLPGVVNEKQSDPDLAERDWPAIRHTLEAALKHLATMRQQEGRAMTADMTANCQSIATNLKQIAARAPQSVENYRVRLEDRIAKVMQSHGVTLNPADLVREVAVYAERSDISEEIVRLESHLGQFDQLMRSSESTGRKLEFLTQEMLREVNTIGSKSSDVDLARYVIDIKAAIERLREMIQNVE